MAITKITTPELFDFSSLNTALKLPTGPTSGTGGRPSNPSTGEWRYNTTLKYVEYYDGAAWFQIDTEAFPSVIPVGNEHFNVNTYFGNGATQIIDAKFNEAANFNGTSSIIKTNLNSGSNNLTYSAWINITAAPSQAYGSIVDGRKHFYTFLAIGQNRKVWLSNDQQVSGDTGDSGYATESTTVLSVGVWYHIVGTLSSTDGGKIYINGIEDNTSPNRTANAPAQTATSCIGSRDGGFRFNGKIDQVRIFNTAITAPQAEDLYTDETTTTAATLNFPAGAGCIAAYQLDGNGDDISGNYSATSTTDVGYTGLKFQPDLVWIKDRDTAGESNRLTDSVRGVTKPIYSNGIFVQGNEPNGLTNFNSNGFTIGSNSAYNTNTNKYVAWNWRAGGAPDATNTNGAGLTPTFGSIMIDDVKSTAALLGNIAAKKISANTVSGFSIVQWEGTGTTGTVAHCLSSTPELILTKNIDTAAADGWPVFTTDTGNQKFLQLNTSSIELTSSGTWNQTDPNNTVFTVGNNDANNKNNNNIIAYCFHSVTGYQKIGTYTGTGNASGEVVNTVFEPSFLMVKATDIAGTWAIYDNKRNTSNPRNTILQPNLSDDDLTSTTLNLSFLTDGFQFTGSNNDVNKLNENYIFLAIA